MPVTPLLDTVASPSDTRGLTVPELKQLADELRAETIDAVSQTGGHLGAGLGVVELTVALHHVYETPKDILIWDVGHQAYPHKILNDNDMSIAPPVGGMSAYMARLVSGAGYRSIRNLGKSMARAFPKPIQEAARKAEEYARGMVTGGTFFEELGFYYVGPIDGPDMDAPVNVLRNARKIEDKPV